ncbi:MULTISPECIES: aldehyde dehydrogenase family protein [Micromonospora]|uniref:Aldehyde dehydrogenase n=1 Tax=Micromonospora solifontis TaxID=2487138 RepID=A0ABX9WJ13_9ACTN|nr:MULTISPECIES: aldehyde dehydrogenase family protein [Micromonospora]NES15600.1 aldehyde dehydrogenase family protein [Micromonospora sp. PPF5-17B]NES35895.1 aldehyde dehydrogenase family protein [Micromonospora solifontis]NES56865.1 aldehyde dehydrogenase family protein [Micromonospora sp. PPF5-6]RNM00185.1 aldehyde dehydrogenase family protein [Micromonospora solifontis]
MTAVHVPGTPIIEDGRLVSTSPATGAEAGRLPVATEADVRDAVARARVAADWWAGLGFTGRRERLLRWRGVIARRIEELAELVHTEGGKPVADAVVEILTALEHIDWAARNAKRVLGPRRVRTRLILAEFTGHLEYQPYGVVGVIGPWNYPVFTPIGSAAYALAAGNAVVFKPSEYTPAVGQWLVDRFAEVVPEQPVLQAVHGLGDVGAALCRAGVGKLAFTGSTRTAKKVMAACAETLTPVLLEAGGKDAMIVDADADLDAAAEACVWGALTNAGQTCIGIERVYAVDQVFDAFVDKVVAKAGRLTVGPDGADIGPITMPSQLDIIRRHIEDGVAAGGRAVLGGADAVQPPYVHPTVLLDVPEDSAAVREETFGPTLTVNRVRDVDEAVERANALPYGLGGSVFGRKRAVAVARRLRSGMASVNSTLTFAGMSTLPFGGVGESGFGRIHGEDGLREFGRAKSITKRRARSMLPAMTFERTPADVARLVKAAKLMYGRGR